MRFVARCGLALTWLALAAGCGSSSNGLTSLQAIDLINDVSQLVVGSFISDETGLYSMRLYDSTAASVRTFGDDDIDHFSQETTLTNIFNNFLFTGISGARASIEGRLALGATSREALMPHIRNAIRSGLIPIVNQMSAAGIITLPGIMTGQLLAGMDPIDAVKYQILLMFLLTGGSALAACGAVYMAAAAISDKRHRLRLDRLAKRLK